MAYVYALLTIAGILVTAALWGRITTGRDGGPPHDARLTIVYFCGLFGALLGAKIAFLLAEGYAYRHDWLALLSGRSITGGLLGGYLAVEIGKRVMRYPGTTGDVFAIVVPVGLLLGRVGCIFAGCCPGAACDPHWWTMVDADGVHRWPAAPVEMLFNAGFLVWAVIATRASLLPGNRFHVYLIAYGLFRFGHEFLRDDARISGAIGGYHLIALAMAGFGAWRLAERRASPRAVPVH
jgi:phosphatidylglycerol:prolipoprotein diacylglycerol transferase